MKARSIQFLCTALIVLAPPGVRAVPPIPEDAKIGGFAVGCQAWTFNRFSVFESIEKTAQAGGKIIEIYPGQKLSPEQADVKLDHNASDEVLAAVREKLAKHGVRVVNYGVVGAKGEAEWRRIFEFAKKLGLYGINTEAVDQMDTIEKLVREFDITVGIHQHARQPSNPNYKVWDPNYVLSVVKNRDRRIGASGDTGHWATSGINAVEALRLLKGRVTSVHLKDRKAIGHETHDAIFGTGIVNIKEVLDELRRQKFAGNISIEYEHNWDNSVPDVAQCIGFFRGYAACTSSE